MTSQSLDATLFASNSQELAKRINPAKLLLALLLVVAGVCLFFSFKFVADESSAVSMALMVGGIAVFLWGLFLFFWKSKEIVYLPTGSVVCEDSFFFDNGQIDALRNVLEQRVPIDDTALATASSGNVRLDCICSKDGTFVAMQLYQYVPYAYTPVTDICYFKGAEAEGYSRFIARCRHDG